MITIIMNGTKSNVRRGLMTSDSCSSTQDGRLPVVLDTYLTLPLQIQIQIQMKMIKGQDIQLIRYVVSGGLCQVCSKSLRQIIRFCWIQEFRFTTSRFQLVLVTINLIISDWYCFENSMHFFIYDVVTAIESFVMAQLSQHKSKPSLQFILFSLQPQWFIAHFCSFCLQIVLFFWLHTSEW